MQKSGVFSKIKRTNLNVQFVSTALGISLAFLPINDVFAAVLCGKTCANFIGTNGFCKDKTQWCGSSYKDVGGNETYAYCMPHQGDVTTPTSSTYIICFDSQTLCHNYGWQSLSGTTNVERRMGYSCKSVGATATQSGANAKLRCIAGYYDASGAGVIGGTSASDITCTACPAGTYGAEPGLGSSTCSGKCVKGSYTSTTAQTACIACQNGKTTSAAGATSCNANCSSYVAYANSWKTASWSSSNAMSNLCSLNNCKAGSYRLASTTTPGCVPCAVGKYMASSAHNNTSCTSCPSHTSNDGSTKTGTTSSTGSDSATDCFLTANSGATWKDSAGNQYDCPTVNASYSN